MKNALLIGLLLLLVSCGNSPLEHNGKIYNCYGALDVTDEKQPNVIYAVNTANIVGTVLLFETIFVPVWNLGWNIYCPVKVLEKK